MEDKQEFASDHFEYTLDVNALLELLRKQILNMLKRLELNRVA